MGDASDFDSIVREYEPRITRYLTAILDDAALAQDLSQETFLRVHRSLDDLQDPRARPAWIFRIAHNIAVDHSRSRVSRQDALTSSLDEDAALVDQSDVQDEELSAEQQLEEQEMSVCMRGYIQDLPPTLRECLILRDLEGLGEQSVAKIIGCSLAAMKVRTHRARRQLREKLRVACEFYQDQRGVLMCEPADKVGEGQRKLD